MCSCGWARVVKPEGAVVGRCCPPALPTPTLPYPTFCREYYGELVQAAAQSADHMPATRDACAMNSVVVHVYGNMHRRCVQGAWRKRSTVAECSVPAMDVVEARYTLP